MIRGASKRIGLLILIIVFSASPGFAQDTGSGMAKIYLKNDSLFTGMLQVRDEICKTSRESECGNARTLLQSEECKQNIFTSTCKAARNTVDSACGCGQAQNTLKSSACRQGPFSPECKEAGDKIDSSSCQDGIIFEGAVGSGEKKPLTICLSPSGYGHVSVRDPGKNSLWKSYRLINNGDTLGYP
jgi:hypothetical protein